MLPSENPTTPLSFPQPIPLTVENLELSKNINYNSSAINWLMNLFSETKKLPLNPQPTDFQSIEQFGINLTGGGMAGVNSATYIGEIIKFLDETYAGIDIFSHIALFGTSTGAYIALFSSVNKTLDEVNIYTEVMPKIIEGGRIDFNKLNNQLMMAFTENDFKILKNRPSPVIISYTNADGKAQFIDLRTAINRTELFRWLAKSANIPFVAKGSDIQDACRRGHFDGGFSVNHTEISREFAENLNLLILAANPPRVENFFTGVRKRSTNLLLQLFIGDNFKLVAAILKSSYTFRETWKQLLSDSLPIGVIYPTQQIDILEKNTNKLNNAITKAREGMRQILNQVFSSSSQQSA